MKDISKRSAFIIDTNWIVQYSEMLEEAAKLPNFEALKRMLGLLTERSLSNFPREFNDL